MHREAVLDARGLAQVMVLFDDPSHPPPVLVAHEFTLTDGAGHDYGPHSDGVRDGDRGERPPARPGARLLEAQAACSTRRCSSSPATTAWRRRTSRSRANPARHPERIGIKTVIGEPMIWLRDLDVQVEPAPDGRTARVIVCDNDADRSGEKPPIAGAEVLVLRAARRGRRHASPPTTPASPGSPPPPTCRRDEIVAAWCGIADFNPRHLRLDGTNLVDRSAAGAVRDVRDVERSVHRVASAARRVAAPAALNARHCNAERHAMRVQIAGVSSLDEALAAEQAGADALGFTVRLPTGVHDGLTESVARGIIAALPPFIATRRDHLRRHGARGGRPLPLPRRLGAAAARTVPDPGAAADPRRRCRT